MGARSHSDTDFFISIRRMPRQRGNRSAVFESVGMAHILLHFLISNAANAATTRKPPCGFRVCRHGSYVITFSHFPYGECRDNEETALRFSSMSAWLISAYIMSCADIKNTLNQVHLIFSVFYYVHIATIANEKRLVRFEWHGSLRLLTPAPSQGSPAFPALYAIQERRTLLWRAYEPHPAALLPRPAPQ